MPEPSSAQSISADIVSKLQNALENEEDLSPDQLMVVLSEALDVILELVAMADRKA
jgi:hypothetical protein